MSFKVEGKQLEVLRNKFVANRLAEEQFFNRNNIREWLIEQRSADVPYMGERGFLIPKILQDGWLKYVHFMHTSGIMVPLCVGESTTASLLKEMGFRAEESSNPHIKEHVSFYDHIAWHLDILKLHVNSYLTFGSIIKLSDDGEKILAFTPGMGRGGGTYRPQFLMSEVAQSLLLTWLSHGGMSDKRYDFQRKERAQGYLCDWLELCINKVENDGKESFEKAVAVSKNGVKIVHADWVFESENVDHDSVYEFRVISADAYSQSKIFRGKEVARAEIAIDSCDDVKRLLSRDVRTIVCNSSFRPNLFTLDMQVYLTIKDKNGGTCTCFISSV